MSSSNHRKNQISISGFGAVSPAGWGIEPLRSAIRKDQIAPATDLARPGWQSALRVRKVPAPATRPSFLGHARLRRTSPITQYAVAAALEALGQTNQRKNPEERLGIVLCVMTGCVNYSRRFYHETLEEPATASPLVFPETVFNAPASHLAALLGTKAISYTLVGDPGTFLQGLALAAVWLGENEVDACLVVGAEEVDWLTADAYRLFNRRVTLAEGAGAICLRRAGDDASGVTLEAVSNSHNYSRGTTRDEACARMRDELLASGQADLLCDGTIGEARQDQPEIRAWKGWRGMRLSPKQNLGEGLATASAWQCALAADWLLERREGSAYVSVAGCNEQAIGARLAWRKTP